MCGIAGFIEFKKNIQTNRNTAVKSMTDAMAHRGPDGEGFFTDEEAGVYFGHRRLAILDLSEKGKQPMQNSTGNLTITFNGEIYNYQEILQELGNPQTKSGTDTEMILFAYEKWGKECVRKFRGMFAFAIYDTQAQTVFLARDHFGQKPLFYSWQEDFFCFCSEVVALVRVLPAMPVINLKALLLFFLHNYRHIPDPETIFAGVFSLEPGATMTIDISAKVFKKNFYVKPCYTHKLDLNEAQLIERYKILLKESVRLTTTSDVPVGILLSGGVDSSSIAAVLAGKGYSSFAVGSSSVDNELVRAKKVASLCRTDHHEIIVDRINFTDMIEVVKAVGQPYNLLSAVFSLRIAKEARAQGIKVLIGGNGADEIFCGYDGAGRLRAFDMALSILPFSNNIKRMVKPFIYRRAARKLLRTIFTKEFGNSVQGFDPSGPIRQMEALVSTDSLLELNYFTGLMLENQHSVTIIGDSTGMQCGLEIRTPFLDPAMFDFATSLPIQMKVPDFFGKTRNKYIMRKALENMLDSEIAWASKQGFGFHFDLHSLMTKQWKNEVEDIIRSLVLRTNFFDESAVQRLWNSSLQGDKSQTSLLWGLVSFGIFLKEVYYK